MIRKVFIFLPLAFFSYAEQDSFHPEYMDEQLKEVLEVQSRFPGYRVYYDYGKAIKEVKQEIESSKEEEDSSDKKN